MKKIMSFLTILFFLSLGMPRVHANISQELDPMLPVEPESAATVESSGGTATPGPVSNVVSTAGAVKSDQKEKGKAKKEKSKKKSKKKSAEKKDSKPSSKGLRKQKKNS